MQAALNGAQGFELPGLWKRVDRQYMMRSEKRPGYRPQPGNFGGPGGRKRRPRNTLYAILTILLLIVLWPVGLIPLWVRRLRWRSFVKATVTVATGIAFLTGLAYLLTLDTQNDMITMAQKSVQDSMTYISESMEYAAGHSDQYATNVSRIASSAASLSQKALLSVVPAAKNNMDALAAQSGKMTGLVIRGAAGGFRQALYDTGLSPTPTPMPTLAPTPTPGPTPSPTPEPSAPVEMVWFVFDEMTYHNDPTCGGRSGAEEIPLSVAKEMGLTACPDCVLNADESAQPSTPEPAETAMAVITQSTSPLDTLSPAATPLAEAKAVESVSPAAEPAVSAELPATPNAPTALATPSPSPSLTPVATATPEPTVAPTPVPLPWVEPLGEMLVWHTTNGKYYHVDEHCSGMLNATQFTLQSSVDAGFKPCPKCKPPAAELLTEKFVVWCGTDRVFHITSKCEAIDGIPTVMTFEEALLEEGYMGCPDCGANLYEESARVPESTPVPAPAS